MTSVFIYLRISTFNNNLYIKHFFPILLSEIFLLLIFFFFAKSLGQMEENAQNLSSSESKPIQDNKGYVKKEHEGITVRYFQTKSLCH